jgi:predicted nucleic acid-binding Zn ribbon protein
MISHDAAINPQSSDPVPRAMSDEALPNRNSQPHREKKFGEQNVAGTGAAGAPKQIGSLISQLMARRGYAQVMAAEGLQAALESEVGPVIAAAVKVGNIKRGVLNIYVRDSVTMQELAFGKRGLLKKLQASQPDRVITDLRFHISTSATG